MIGDKGKNLIFLISQPRAGSTMLQRILASHPLIVSSAEPWLMLHPIYALKNDGLEAEYDSMLANIALKDFLAHYADEEDTYIKALRSFAKVLYNRALQEKTDGKYFLDKTPRYYFIIPDLIRLFPDAKFIFLIRNPLAVLDSILRTWIRDNNWPQISYYRNDLLLAPSRIVEGMSILGSEAHVIHYEDIVIKPNETISALFKSMGFSFHRKMLYYTDHIAPKGSLGDNIGINKHKKPSMESLNKWIHLGDKKQTSHFALAYLQSLGSEIIESLGYNYLKLKQKIDQYNFSFSKSVVPWHIAIRPSNSWTREDNLAISKAMLLQKKGPVIGHFSFIKKNYFNIIRSILSV